VSGEVATEGRPNLLGLTRPQLARVLDPCIDRRFRVEQVYRALYLRRVRSFAEMTDLGKGLRQRLAESFSIEWPSCERVEVSADGTRKYLLALADGATIETVSIPERGRRTLCLSSQAGCAMGCTFCVTGHWGAGRNLTAGEIVGQVLVAEAEEGKPATGGLNLVFMGMGEPLQNLVELERALEVLAEEIPWRRMTVSTVGLVPGIEAMAAWPLRPNLAVSLHAPDDERRSKIMPVNRRYPLAVLLAALRRYPIDGHRRLTFEYTLIRGFNDAREDARAAARLIHGLRAKVNVIPLNPDPILGPEMQPPAESVVRRFQRTLLENGVACSVRRTRGDDVRAACGQLRAFGRPPAGAPRRQMTE
jgi:23S rRNA (adenine2503-C2)-methyltransferase